MGKYSEAIKIIEKTLDSNGVHSDDIDELIRRLKIINTLETKIDVKELLSDKV